MLPWCTYLFRQCISFTLKALIVILQLWLSLDFHSQAYFSLSNLYQEKLICLHSEMFKTRQETSRAGGIFFFSPLSQKMQNQKYTLEKSYIELIISYCILGLLDSGALNSFGLPELMMSTLLHRYFSQATAGNQSGEPKKGAWPVLDSSYQGGECVRRAEKGLW